MSLQGRPTALMSEVKIAPIAEGSRREHTSRLAPEVLLSEASKPRNEY